jgi:translation initiation factor 2B subunit (eIF-2B alpha/beta/delta family)
MAVASSAARDYAERAERAIAETARCAAGLIADGSVVLTHSRSSTVLAGLFEAHRAGRRFEVVATESRPAFEGRDLAKALAGEGMDVTLIADAAASVLLERSSHVLVGADMLTASYVINKIGTRMIALAASDLGIPMYALCDSTKFMSVRDDPVAAKALSSEGRPEELWPDAPANVRLVNVYFEPAPLRCFTRIITEEGALTPNEIADRIEKI